MALNARFIFLFSIIAVTKSSVLDSLARCPLNDGECQRHLFEKILRGIGKTGVEEFGIPPVDPFHLKNVSAVAAFDLVKLTMVDGVATGAKDCIVNNLTLELDQGHAWMDVVCNISLKGHYAAFSDSPLLEAVFGKEPVRGDGLGKIRAENIKIMIDFDLHVEKDSDGEIYIRNGEEKFKYDVDFLGRVLFYCENLKLGGREMSKFAMNILNTGDVGKSLLNMLGGPFVDKAFEFFYTFNKKFINNVPARYYIADDLSPYIKN